MNKTENFFNNLLSCSICREYLVLSTLSPLRCPGLSYNVDGEQIVNSGRLWSEIVKEHETESREELASFYEKHKEHIDNHLEKMRGS